MAEFLFGINGEKKLVSNFNGVKFGVAKLRATELRVRVRVRKNCELGPKNSKI